MDGGEEERHVFRCPECDETMEVNAAMKEVLVERGCVICGADLTAAAFTDPEPS